MVTRRPKNVSKALAGVCELKGSSLTLKARNSNLPISWHLYANLITISNLAICPGGTPSLTGVARKLKPRPLA